jgi:SAM-dependent methyltransferase
MKTPAAPVTVDAPVTELLNGYIGTHILYGLIMTGVLDTLHESSGPVPVSELAESADATEHILRALLRCADRLNLAHYDDGADTVELTSVGKDAYRVRGYFTVSVGGFGDIFRRLDSLMTGVDAFGRSVRQDHRLTALGCSQNWAFQQPVFDDAVRGLSFTRIADIGCGAARRLIHLVESFPGTTAVGVDVSEEVCDLARQNIARAGLEHRISVVRADVMDLVREPENYPDVGGRPFLTALHAAFGRAGHFVVADGFRDVDFEPGHAGPIFTPAYELFHDFIGVDLHSHASQRAMFVANGFEVVTELPFGHPLEWLFVLRPHGR